MKKSLTVIAALMLGGVALTAAPRTAKPSKAMTQYGPVALAGTTDSYKVSGLEVLEITEGGTVILSKAKKGSATKSVGPVQLPAGYDEKGAATQWDWADVTPVIVGFSGKLVYLLINNDMTGEQRIYAYQLNKAEDKIKITGSTSNLTNFTGQISSDGKKVWVESEVFGSIKIQQFDKKLNGLYDKGDKSKLYNAKSSIDSQFTDQSAGVVLPDVVKKYSYTETNNSGTTEIKIYK